MRLSKILCIAAICAIATPAFAQTGGEDCTVADPVAEGSFNFDTTLAILDGPTDCDVNMGPDVWYVYTASLSGAARINTCTTTGTLTDTTLIVYDATAGCPLPGDLGLACDDDTCVPTAGGAGFSSEVIIPVTAGNTYYVQVGGWNGGTGTGTLLIEGIEGLCFDGLDDDLDGLIDCADPDCATQCVEFPNNCLDGIDNDGDGDVDCLDTDCAGTAQCVEFPNNCGDGFDNDLDGLIDCLDPDCAPDNLCAPPITNDNCADAISVGVGVTAAQNNIPATLDGPTACDANMTTDVWYEFTATGDYDAVIGICGSTGSLTDTTLIVYDGAAGCPLPGDPGLACDDDTCAPAAGGANFLSTVTVPMIAGDSVLIQVGGWNGTVGTFDLTIDVQEGVCNDGIDNDGDGDIDCGDADCALDAACFESDCADGLDSDNDGLTDCADPDCAAATNCDESLNCTDAIDNDLDGDIDCADTDCDFAPACFVLANDNCVDAIAVGTGPTDFANINATLDGPTACDANMTTDVWFEFTSPTAGTFTVETCGATGTMTDTTLIVYDGTAGCPLPGDAGLACDDDGCVTPGFSSTVTVSLGAGQPLLIQVGGWNGGTGSSTLNIIEQVAAPTAMVCTDNGVDTVTANWVPATGGPGIDSQNVYENGVLVASLGPADSSWPVAYAPGFVGVIEVCVETIFAGTASIQACCALGIGGSANDNCANALPLTLGVVETGNLTADTPDGASTCGASTGNPDAWWTYTAGTDGTYNFSTCGTHDAPGQDLGMDTVLNVFDVCGGIELGCDDDAGPPPCPGSDVGILRDSVVSVAMLAGETVTVRVSHFGGVIANGDYFVQVNQECGDIGVATCTVNGAGDVDVTWTDNPNATLGYEIFENGISVGTAPAGSSLFTVVGPAGGLNTYEVTWVCALGGGPGTGANCSVTIVAPIPAGTTDVILANEDVALGLIDSGLALDTALTAAGQTVYRVNSPDFDLSGLDFSGVDRIWCCFGTFPNDYRISQGEGDLLATLNAGGTGVYFEGGDHWGFVHQISLFDDRDGVDTALDGNDTFVSMDAVVGTAVDFSSLGAAIPYNQDNAGNDWTDQLTVAAADLDVTLAEATWQQAGGGYLTGVYAEHAAGGNTLVQSWEFGGFGGDQNALAAAYLGQLGGGGPPLEQFIRGDANRDGGVNIADAIFILGVLFPGAGGANVLSCLDAGDVNDDGTVNIADAIFLLGNLFPGPGGAPGIPAPSPACGADPTADALDCAAYANCP